MSIASLNIKDFRNISYAELSFSQQCNIFYGKNGSGKTSLLEAIYYLILGRSFRSHLLRRIVKQGANSFSLYGKILQESNQVAVGITKSISAEKQIKIAGKNVSSILEITKISPLQLLTHNSYLLLYEGPKIRRQLIDWGMFHVKQSFLELWRKIERILEQRNKAIRTKQSIDYIKAWDKELALLGLALHNYRKQYVESLLPVVTDILQKLSCNFSANIIYNPGWDTNLDLYCALENSLKNDLQFGYTTVGPQRADLQILVGKIPAKDILSRGQQKLLLYGLQIAQGILLDKLTNKKCIYLVDDLLAELDHHKCRLLANILLSLPKTQIFVTGLIAKDLEQILANNEGDRKLFNLENQFEAQSVGISA